MQGTIPSKFILCHVLRTLWNIRFIGNAAYNPFPLDNSAQCRG